MPTPGGAAPRATASHNIPRQKAHSAQNAQNTQNAHVPPNGRAAPQPDQIPNATKRWSPENYHELLGVSKGETDIGKLEKARRQLAMKFHPDRWSTKSAAERSVAEETMKDINAAFDAMKAYAEEAQKQSA